jgi:hypothetical protein
MNWTSKHPVEVTAEWGAPILLAIAAGWAASTAGLPLVAVGASATMSLALGVIGMRLAGGSPICPEPNFQPVAFEDAVGEPDELLLDDPLTEIPADSRVVRLFARPEPTPGELVLRIEDYLSDGRRVPAEASAGDQRPIDASAALHAALANIRASLR